jgi:predicted O-methyltransferase YrrM
MSNNDSIDLTGNLRTSLQVLYPTEPDNSMKCVEIGSFEGLGSLLIHDYLCKNSDSQLVCIDPFDDEYVKGNEKMSFWDHACNGQYAKFQHNTKGIHKIVEKRGTSDMMIPTLDDKSIDFCYIDGDHSPEQVYKDIVNMFGKMKSGGIVLFDDYLWNINGIQTKLGIDRFLNEYKGKFELIFKNYQLALRIV